MDFAFFAARLGWSRSDYEEMTPVQRLFILKELERETVRRTELLQSVVEIAIANVHRKKGRKPKRLWSKRRAEGEERKPAIGKAEMDGLRALLASKRSKG